jgi:hypothetical protein
VQNSPSRTIKCSGSRDITMADLAAFKFLLVYLLSASGFPTEGYPGIFGMPSSSHSWPVQLSGIIPLLPLCFGTHNNAQPLPLLTSIASNTTSASSPLPPSPQPPVSGHSTATSVTSFTTTSDDVISKEDCALLTTLQECAIHALPGPCPACTSTCGVTIT